MAHTGMAPAPGPAPVEPLLPHEMEHIRRVYDEDCAKKKFSSVCSPREDAQMFRSVEKRTLPCECIVELYELLWRWGRRTSGSRNFVANFGFQIPDTVVFVKGKPYAWYFISRKDGSLLRKSTENLSISKLEKKLCKNNIDEPGVVPPIVATWYPMASQFPEARCHSAYADFLTASGCRNFFSTLRHSSSGILQAFVQPYSICNFLVRTMQFRDQVSLCTRTNRAQLGKAKANVFDRAATFEGWEGLSSSNSRYQCHKHPHMEELILAAGEMLNRQIEEERVRQMLFLSPNQHVALHWKIDADHMLYFVFASVVTEREVILQSRPRLLMGDLVMTEELRMAALLPGGTEKRALPYEAPSCMVRKIVDGEENSSDPGDSISVNATLLQASQREGSLPPMQFGRPVTGSSDERGATDVLSTARRRRPLSERRHPHPIDAIFPKMVYSRPEVPVAPYRFQQGSSNPVEDFAVPSCFSLSAMKRPLVALNSPRSEQPLSFRPDNVDAVSGR